MSKRALRIPTLRAKRRQPAKPVVKNRRAAAASRKTRSSATTAAPPGTTVATTMFAAAIVTLFVAATLAFRRPEPVAAAAADAQPDQLHQSSDIAVAMPPVALPSAPTAVRAAVAPVVAPRAISESSEKARLSKAEKNQIAESATPAEAVSAISEALGRIEPTTTLVSEESISAEPAVVAPDPAEPGTVTITGCLEGSVNEGRFRLTDTEGVGAPRSRSWRTGFLKKRSNSVDLVDPPDPHALQTQVGQRVAATGLLTNSELRMTSLRTIRARCN
jgi:hypothetical protein